MKFKKSFESLLFLNSEVVVLISFSLIFSTGFRDNASALRFVLTALYTTSKSYSANFNLHLVTR